VYRIALFAQGFNGDIASDQALFSTLESGMIFVALLKMILTPPGWFIGREGWKLSWWDEKRWQILDTKDPSSTVDSIYSSDVQIPAQEPYVPYDADAYARDFPSSTISNGDLSDQPLNEQPVYQPHKPYGSNGAKAYSRELTFS
jgi:hypothetical protein